MALTNELFDSTETLVSGKKKNTYKHAVKTAAGVMVQMRIKRVEGR